MFFWVERGLFGQSIFFPSCPIKVALSPIEVETRCEGVFWLLLFMVVRGLLGSQYALLLVLLRWSFILLRWRVGVRDIFDYCCSCCWLRELVITEGYASPIKT